MVSKLTDLMRHCWAFPVKQAMGTAWPPNAQHNKQKISIAKPAPWLPINIFALNEHLPLYLFSNKHILNLLHDNFFYTVCSNSPSVDANRLRLCVMTNGEYHE